MAKMQPPDAKVLVFNSCTLENVMAAVGDGHASVDLIGCSPSLPPAGCVELTPLDVYCASFGLVRWAFVFPAHLDAPIVKAALSHVLRLYPLLAGRVVRVHGGDGGSGRPHRVGVSYDLSAHGLQFVQATSSLSADDIVLPRPDSCSSNGNVTNVPGDSQPSNCGTADSHSEAGPHMRLAMHVPTDMAVINEHMAPESVDQMIDGPPVPLARAVMCHLAPSSSSGSSSGSSTLLCMAIQHLLMDGVSLRMFLQDWAAVCRALLHGGCAHISAPPTFGRQCWDGLVAAARGAAVGVGGEEGDGAQPQHWCCDLGPPPAPVTVAAAPTVSETVAAMLAPRSPTPCSYPLAPYRVIHISKQHIAALKHQAAKEQWHGVGADGTSRSSSGSMHHATDSSAQTTQHSMHSKAHGHAAGTAAKASGAAWVSSNDVVCAAAWRGIAQLSSRMTSKAQCFMRVVEFRPRLHLLSDVTLDKRAIGNWFLLQPTTRPVSSPSTTLGQLAVALRSDLHSQLKECVLSKVAYLDWAEQQGVSTRVGLRRSLLAAQHDAGLSSTAWDASPQQLDFGWGPPVWFQPVRRGSLQNMTMCLSDMQGDGIWLYCALTEADRSELVAAGGFPSPCV